MLAQLPQHESALQDSGDPLVTQEMVRIRAVAVANGAYAASDFFPLDIAQALRQINQRVADMNNNLNQRFENLDNSLENMNQRFGNVDNSLENIKNHLENMEKPLLAIEAHAVNVRIIRRNGLQTPHALEPLQKSVAGYGRDLAVPLIAAMDQNDRNTFNEQCPSNGNPSEVGTTPPNFNALIDGYRHLDICKLIVFYNETFGIIPEDDLAVRIQKFRRYLSVF